MDQRAINVLRSKLTIAPLALLVLAGAAHARPKGPVPKAKRTTGAAKRATGDVKAQAGAAQEKFRQDFINSTKQYQASLQAVAASYSEQLKTVTDRNATMKDLFNKGLISRVEMEKSDSAVADNRAKVDKAQKEIKLSDTALSAALNPASVVTDTRVGNSTGVVGTSANWTTGNGKIDQLIRYYGKRYEVDPYLIYLVMHQESGFNSSAVSSKGAQGLMQLMPGTAARYGVKNPADPAQNIRGGAHYLSDLLQLFNGNVSLALAGYNAGEGAVMKYGNRVPPYQETRYYIRNISDKYKRGG